MISTLPGEVGRCYDSVPAWLPARLSFQERFRFRLANIKSQMKRNRQNETRNERNKGLRSELKTRVKGALAAAEAGDAEQAQELTRQAQKRIDMAVTKGVLHKNTAARRKAKLVRDVSALLDG